MEIERVGSLLFCGVRSSLGGGHQEIEHGLAGR